VTTAPPRCSSTSEPAGAPGFSLAASVCALGGFVVGAAVGGRILAARAGGPVRAHRGRLLRDGAAIETLVLTFALVIALAAGPALSSPARDGIAALAAVAMGSQNAVVRGLGVPDLTTTVLTMTLTGIATDVRAQGWGGIAMRVLAVLTMFAGAVAGTLLVLHVSAQVALGVAVALVFTVTAAASLVARGSASWH
jgi:uncharacterized membrane protein YoaK (UPF0700 family)